MDSLHCLYASKPCGQARTFKDDGELHRLCLFHRTRANDAQRRWHSRQRAGANITATGDAITEISARTKRRRRAAEADGENMPPRRRQRAAKGEIKRLADVCIPAYGCIPASPPSVDSATFDLLFNGTQTAPFEPCDDQMRLSAEDLALLNELMMGLEDT